MASAALKEQVVRLSLVCPSPVLSVSPLRTFTQSAEVRELAFTIDDAATLRFDAVVK